MSEWIEYHQILYVFCVAFIVGTIFSSVIVFTSKIIYK